jgi:sulfhydrogenase subunit gamma (sulfur reductase)
MSSAAVEADRELYVPQAARLAQIVPQTDNDTLFRLELTDGGALGHQPGQFVMVSVMGVGEAPISVSSGPSPGPEFELCVRAVGNVTNALHRLEQGAEVGIRGPMGNGFPMDQLKGRDLLVVAGGIGLVPLRSVVEAVLSGREDYGRLTVLYGMRSPDEMLYKEMLQDWDERNDLDLGLTVDRAHPDWDGHVGVITTLFPDLDISGPDTTALVVGPPVMYQFVIIECVNKGIADHEMILSLERRMKCGVGKCGHCQINNKYVCVDGPVFNYAELKLMWEAI